MASVNNFKRPRTTDDEFEDNEEEGNANSDNIDMKDNELPPLSLSILGVEPLDEFTREIADFIHRMIATRPNITPTSSSSAVAHVEVEAKIGLLRDKHSGQRLQLPVLSETILVPDSIDLRFESNMSTSQHKHYNQLLNGLKTTSASQNHPSSPLSYKHLYLVDSFYAPTSPSVDTRQKIRVTRDEKTKTVIECVQKIRLGDLNIYSPKQGADWRVSVNLEVPVSHPVGTPTHTRRKDRLSYSHEEFNIDLTQVTSSNQGNPPSSSSTTLLHELELEIARPNLLLALASARGATYLDGPQRGALTEKGAAFDELIRAFVNNARILVRNADRGEGWG